MLINTPDLRMTAAGINTPSALLPVGVHLRWGFSSDRRAAGGSGNYDGFLISGFSIYRRLHDQGGGTSVTATLASEGTVPLPSEPGPFEFTGASGVIYSLDSTKIGVALPAALDTVVSNHAGPWTAILPDKAFQLECSYTTTVASGFLRLKGREGVRTVAAKETAGVMGPTTLGATADLITDILVESDSSVLTEFRWWRVESSLNLALWTLLASGLAPSDDWAVVSPRLLTGEIARLGGPGNPPWDGLAQTIGDLYSGVTAPLSLGPGSDPAPAGASLTLLPVYRLLAASLDPTVARAIGLLFIDTTVAGGVLYDYLVEGIYPDGVFYWITRRVGRSTAVTVKPPTGLHLTGSYGLRRYDPGAGTHRPCGRVAARWRPPVDTAGFVLAGSPVRYVVETQPLGQGNSPDPIDPAAWVQLSAPGPVVRMPDASSTSTTLKWSDDALLHPGLDHGWYGYRVEGLDLFGQTSAALGPGTVLVPRDPSPPPPRAVVARYLDSSVPDLTSEESAWVATHTSGVRVRLAWTREREHQHGSVTEFRVYYRPGTADRRTAAITAVIDNGDGTAEVQTDLNLVAAPGDFTAGWLQSGGRRYLIQSQTTTAAASFTVVAASVFDPDVDANVALIPDPGETCTVEADLRASTRWYERIGVQAKDQVELASTVTSSASTSGTGLVELEVSPVAFSAHAGAGPGILYDEDSGRRYAVLSHTVDTSGNLTGLAIRVSIDGDGAIEHEPAVGANLSYLPGYELWLPGVSLSASAAAPFFQALIAVSSADDDATVGDSPKWSSGSFGGRSGNEGWTSPASGILSIWRIAPASPTVGSPPTVLASKPDYNGVSRVTLGWTYAAGLRYHLLRATVESILAAYVRDVAPTTGPDDYTDVDVLGFAAPGSYDELFAPVNASPIDESWLDGTDIIYEDHLPGRGTNRFVYRVIAEDAVGNRSAPTLMSDVIYLPIPEPRAPVIVKTLGGNGEISVTWRRVRDARFLVDDGAGGTTAATHRPELFEYRIYRTQDAEAARDVRLMTLVGTHNPTLDAPTETWTDTGLTPGTLTYYRVTAVTRRSATAVAEERESAASGLGVAKAVSMSEPEDPTWTTSSYNSGTGEVELAWSATATDIEVQVERQVLAVYAPWTVVGSGYLDPGTSSTTDADVESGQSYTYRLRVRNPTGFTILASTTAAVSVP